MRKQAEGLRVNLIYDSLGSFSNPAAFFQRLRDGGIHVVEFNPQNPLKAGGKWVCLGVWLHLGALQCQVRHPARDGSCFPHKANGFSLDVDRLHAILYIHYSNRRGGLE
jgi:hypothetical protein